MLKFDCSRPLTTFRPLPLRPRSERQRFPQRLILSPESRQTACWGKTSKTAGRSLPVACDARGGSSANVQVNLPRFYPQSVNERATCAHTPCVSTLTALGTSN
jgi:hypothetical protein